MARLRFMISRGLLHIFNAISITGELRSHFSVKTNILDFYLQQSSPNAKIPKIRGLTSAASIWVAAALGAAVGCGLWQLGLYGAFLTLITLSGVKRIKRIERIKQSRLLQKNYQRKAKNSLKNTQNTIN